MSIIYLDHNATTRPDHEVVAAVAHCLHEDWGNPSSSHARGAQAKAALALARTRVASLLGARPAEIVFTSGATESNHAAILGALAAQSGKRHIVTSAVEHPSTLRLLAQLEGQGVRVTRLAVDAHGQLDVAQIQSALTPQTALLSLMWANNETGVVFPIAEAATVAAAHQVPIHVDAVQAIGKVAVDVARVPVDLLSVSAHKLHGPAGTGALFVRKGLALPALFHGQQERNRRGGTENLAGIVGFGVAAEHLACAWRTTAAEATRLRDDFEARLRSRFAGLRVNGARATRVGNTSNIGFGALPSEVILNRLDAEGVCASSGSACSAGGTEPSHVLLAMGQAAPTALAAVRFSFGRGNTAAELERVVELLTDIIQTQSADLVAAA
jgi:cysteine desulfurase